MKSKIIFFLYYIIVSFLYGQTTMNLEIITSGGVYRARIIKENNNEAYFIGGIGGNSYIKRLDKKTMTFEKFEKFYTVFGIFDDKVFVTRYNSKGLFHTDHIYDYIKREDSFPGKYEYLWKDLAYEKFNIIYYQNNIFFGTRDYDSGVMGLGHRATFEIDITKQQGKKIIKENYGFGATRISDDKQHLLVDQINETSVYNIQTKILTKAIPISTEVVYREYNGFMTNKIVFSKAENRRYWIFFSLAGDDLLKLKLMIMDDYVTDLRVFNWGKMAIANDQYIVDTTPILRLLAAKGQYFTPTTGTILSNNVKVFENANPDAPILGTLKKNTEVNVADESGSQTTYNKQTAYWYRVKTKGGINGWVFGTKLKFLKVDFPIIENPRIEEKVDEHAAPAINNFLYSNYFSNKKDYYRYHPIKAFDGEPASSWMESSRDSGIEDYVGFELNREITIDAIEIMPGYFDKKWWKANNRVRILKMDLDGSAYNLIFSDDMKPQLKLLASDVTFKRAIFTLKKVYFSHKWNDTAISEIKFFYKSKEIKLDLTPVNKYLKKVTKAEVTEN